MSLNFKTDCNVTRVELASENRYTILFNQINAWLTNLLLPCAIEVKGPMTCSNGNTTNTSIPYIAPFNKVSDVDFLQIY